MCASSLSADNGLGESKASHTLHQFPGKINTAGLGLQSRAALDSGQDRHSPFLGTVLARDTHRGEVVTPELPSSLPGAVPGEGQQGQAGDGPGQAPEELQVTARTACASSWTQTEL